MSGEIHELTEVMVRKVFANNKAWSTDAALNPFVPPESLVAELSEAMKVYGDTLTREATRQIVLMTVSLDGYQDCALERWKLIYQINNVRVQLLVLDPKDKNKTAAVLGGILTSMGIKLGEIDATS